MKTNILNNRVKGVLPLFFLLGLFSCKKETTEIGANLRQDKGGINSINVQYTDIASRTVAGDSFVLVPGAPRILGVINDPLFGLRKSSVVVQPRLSELGGDFNNVVADSIDLILRYDRIQLVGNQAFSLQYGDTNSVITLDIYQLDEVLEQDSLYPVNYNPQLGNKIGEYTGTFNINTTTSGVVDGDTVTFLPELKVRLDQSFGQQLVDLDPSSFSDQESFASAIKGIALVPRNNTSSGEGAIVAVETFSSASGLLLYYDTLVKAFPMSQESKSFSFYETERSTEIEAQMNGTGSFTKVYPQSLLGGKVRVDISELNQIIEGGEEIVVNEAKIEFSLDESTVVDGVYDAPGSFFLLVPDTTNPERALTVIDDDNDPRFASGALDGSTYNIFFNRYLQDLVKDYNNTGINYFNGFYLTIPRTNPAVPYRTVINSDNTKGDIKVSVTYTKLK